MVEGSVAVSVPTLVPFVSVRLLWWQLQTAMQSNPCKNNRMRQGAKEYTAQQCWRQDRKESRERRQKQPQTYLGARLQVLASNRVLVEALPLLKGLLSALLVLVAPVEHALAEFDAHALAVAAQDTLGVVEEVVGVNDANLDALILVGRAVDAVGGCGAVHAVGRRSAVRAVGAIRSGLFVILPRNLGPHETGVLEVVENAAQLVVASLSGVKVVEASNGVQRWYRAAEVRRNRVARVADQESPVELGQQLRRHHGRVAFFDLGGVGVWRHGCWERLDVLRLLRQLDCRGALDATTIGDGGIVRV